MLTPQAKRLENTHAHGSMPNCMVTCTSSISGVRSRPRIAVAPSPEIGIDILERSVQVPLTDNTEPFVAEAALVVQASLEGPMCIS